MCNKSAKTTPTDWPRGEYLCLVFGVCRRWLIDHLAAANVNFMLWHCIGVYVGSSKLNGSNGNTFIFALVLRSSNFTLCLQIQRRDDSRQRAGCDARRERMKRPDASGRSLSASHTRRWRCPDDARSSCTQALFELPRLHLKRDFYNKTWTQDLSIRF